MRFIVIRTWSSRHKVWNPGRCLLNSTINWTVSIVISVMCRNKWSDWSEEVVAPSSWSGTWYTRLRSSSVGCSNSSWKNTSLLKVKLMLINVRSISIYTLKSCLSYFYDVPVNQFLFFRFQGANYFQVTNTSFGETIVT